MPNKMESMDGKRVSKIFFDESEGIYFDDTVTGELSYEFHGDHAECWVVVSQDGVERSRFNTTKISSIEWLLEGK